VFEFDNAQAWFFGARGGVVSMFRQNEGRRYDSDMPPHRPRFGKHRGQATTG
jgi:hypothetical protein